MSNIRKAVHDQLITDFGNLTFDASTNKLFVQVKKAFMDLPNVLPVCEIFASNTLPEILSDAEDTRVYTFQAIVSDLIDSEATNEATSILTIDRLSQIEDRILDYLQKIPNNLVGKLTDINVYRIQPTATVYDYAESTRGIELIMSISFDIYININVRNL